MDDAHYFSPDYPYLISIGLQNFQTIREYAEIPIAPLTLIYGPNSAGKSAIADALQFGASLASSETIEGMAALAHKVKRWGSRSRFDSPLAHRFVGHPSDLVLSYEYKLTRSVLSNWINAIGGDAVHPADVQNLQGVSRRYGDRLDAFLSIEYPQADSAETDWSYLELKDSITVRLSFGKSETPSEISVLTQELPIFHCYPGHRGSFRFNSGHPRFQDLDGGWMDGGLFVVMGKHFPAVRMDGDWIVVDQADLSGYSGESLFESGAASALPRQLLVLLKFFSSGVLVGLRAACELLQVGPVRAIPSAVDSVFPVRDYGEWFRSAEQASIFAPWDYLASAATRMDYPSWRGTVFRPENLLSYVNRILSHPVFLDTEYQLVGERRFLATEAQLLTLFREPEDRRAAAMDKLLSEVHLFLRSSAVQGDVEIEDVGAGISQVIPVIAACGTSNQIHVQQPELHLHPRLQAQLADVFIERINTAFDSLRNEDIGNGLTGCSSMPSQVTIDAARALAEQQNENSRRKGTYRTMALLETHSEHLILRVLRRIRETSTAQIKSRLFRLRPEQVSVLYFDKHADGATIVRHLRIAPDGEFIDRWPRGFFTEREAELFDE